MKMQRNLRRAAAAVVVFFALGLAAPAQAARGQGRVELGPGLVESGRQVWTTAWGAITPAGGEGEVDISCEEDCDKGAGIDPNG